MTREALIKIRQEPASHRSSQTKRLGGISKERSGVNVKNFDAILYRERKENGRFRIPWSFFLDLEQI